MPREEPYRLHNDRVVMIQTPNLAWWYDWLIPHISVRTDVKAIDPAIKKQLIDEVTANQLTPETLGKLPMPMLDLLLDIVAYYVKETPTWCKENLDLVDFLGILSVFLRLADARRLVDFFEDIGQQIPEAATLLMAGGPLKEVSRR